MSTISVDNFEDLSASKSIDSVYVTDGTAKYWASFTNSGTVNDSLNTSSATDEGTGNYSNAITSAFGSTSIDRTASANNGNSTISACLAATADNTVSKQEMLCFTAAGANADSFVLSMAATGDLA